MIIVQDWGLATITETDSKAAQRSSSKDLSHGTPTVERSAASQANAHTPRQNEQHATPPNSARGEGHFSVCS